MAIKNNARTGERPVMERNVMRTCNFRVPGIPIAQPRPKVALRGKHPHAYVPKKHPIHNYRASVVAAFSKLNSTYRRPFEGAISIGLTFWFPRTQAITWKTKPMLTLPKTTKPDVDNLVKGVMDALEGHAYESDAAVVEVRALKWYVPGDAGPRTDVSLCEFNGVSE